MTIFIMNYMLNIYTMDIIHYELYIKYINQHLFLYDFSFSVTTTLREIQIERNHQSDHISLFT